MSDRTDVVVDLLDSEVKLTGKVMPNGEIRRRVRFGDVTIHITETQVGGWQEAHLHKGLNETYTVLDGTMVLVWNDGDVDDPSEVRRYESGESVTVPNEIPHNVFLDASTTIAVVVYGTPVDNPDKNGNDWWDADPAFNAWTRQLTDDDIARLAK